METLQNLMECLTPDIETTDRVCDYCKSHAATVIFTLKDNYTNLNEIVDLCDDCINEESVFANKKVLRQTSLK